MKGEFKKEFAGKVRGFAFNMLTWEYVCESLNLPLSDVLGLLEGASSIKVMRVMIFSSLKSYADINGEELDINALQVGAEMGDNKAFLPEFLAEMTASMDTGKKIAGEVSKKKSGLKT